ncbi:MAG: hypothetical protein WBP58_11340 [Chitinophagaceae bacterium]
MGTPSNWYRILLTLILAGGFFITVEEGLAKKSIADSINQICAGSEDADDETFTLDGPDTDITLTGDSFELSDSASGIEPKTPSANPRKLFLLYQQWKLHC